MSMMKGSQATVQILLSEGVEYIFGLPGSTEAQFMDALEDQPEIKYILGLHEGIAAGMAAGYSRASGKTGVLNFHAYPGIGAAMGILTEAFLGGISLVVTAGYPDRHSLIQEGVLTTDLVTLGQHFSKWSTEVVYPQDLDLIMRRATAHAVYRITNWRPAVNSSRAYRATCLLSCPCCPSGNCKALFSSCLYEPGVAAEKRQRGGIFL